MAGIMSCLHDGIQFKDIKFRTNKDSKVSEIIIHSFCIFLYLFFIPSLIFYILLPSLILTMLL